MVTCLGCNRAVMKCTGQFSMCESRNARPVCRPLFCPICGAKVMVEVANTQFPEVDVIPDHVSANGMNVCQGCVITVTIDFDKCQKCGGKMSKNLTGLCHVCYCEEMP